MEYLRWKSTQADQGFIPGNRTHGTPSKATITQQTPPGLVIFLQLATSTIVYKVEKNRLVRWYPVVVPLLARSFLAGQYLWELMCLYSTAPAVSSNYNKQIQYTLIWSFFTFNTSGISPPSTVYFLCCFTSQETINRWKIVKLEQILVILMYGKIYNSKNFWIQSFKQT